MGKGNSSGTGREVIHNDAKRMTDYLKLPTGEYVARHGFSGWRMARWRTRAEKLCQRANGAKR